MSKFKVGDRVRVSRDAHAGSEGLVHEVWRMIAGSQAYVVAFPYGDESFFEEDLEPVEGDLTPTLKDSGDRREFETGAVRDMAKGKGRCDLLPIKSFSWLLGYKEGRVMANIETFKQSGSSKDLKSAIKNLAESRDYDPNYGISECGFDLDRSVASMILDVSLQFEAGAEKYGEGNWQKGIPTYVYIDSAVRHYLKHLRGDTDEPHLRATVWNLLCCLWTVENLPELNTYAKEAKR